MKKLIDLIRTHTAVFGLLIFLGMIIPSLFLYPAAESSSQTGISLCLAVVVLANLAAVLPPGKK